MDPTNLKELLHAIWVECLRYRYWIVSIFIVLSSLTLAAGHLMPKSYTSKVVLHADVTNIIGDLLKGKAQITEIDRAKEARDTIFTDRLLRTVASKAGFEDPEAAISALRTRMRISANGDYVTVAYTAASAEQAFSVIDATTQGFLEETTRKKREESQSAYEFINAQVEGYKRQLEQAESALKDFQSQNIDITESSVASRVSQYKNDIQMLKLQIQDSESRLASYERQLAQEPEFLQIEAEKVVSFEERQLEDFERKLSDLRLLYQDTHPDIISIKDQIAELRAKVAADAELNAGKKNFSRVENPAYTSLKEVINAERAELSANQNRLNNTERLLQSEMANAQTVAAKQATYKELTRDYSVTKDVYEDMLKTRENARLSMTLDIEGQGVSYKIHEPVSYPLRSNGLQLIHFALIGPALGLVAPLALIVLLVLLDPRVRSASYMAQNLPAHITLMTSIPMYHSAVLELASKRSLILLLVVLVLYLAVYLTFSVGLIPMGTLSVLG